MPDHLGHLLHSRDQVSPKGVDIATSLWWFHLKRPPFGLFRLPGRTVSVGDPEAATWALEIELKNLGRQFGTVDDPSHTVGKFNDDGRTRVVLGVFAALAIVDRAVLLKALFVCRDDPDGFGIGEEAHGINEMGAIAKEHGAAAAHVGHDACQPPDLSSPDRLRDGLI